MYNHHLPRETPLSNQSSSSLLDDVRTRCLVSDAVELLAVLLVRNFLQLENSLAIKTILQVVDNVQRVGVDCCCRILIHRTTSFSPGKVNPSHISIRFIEFDPVLPDNVSYTRRIKVHWHWALLRKTGRCNGGTPPSEH
eukprot:scaffold13805_cov136-Skeletonema_marinoi.AAC.4